MKLHDDLKALIQEALDVRKKDGTEVFKDDDHLAIGINGYFYQYRFNPENELVNQQGDPLLNGMTQTMPWWAMAVRWLLSITCIVNLYFIKSYFKILEMLHCLKN